MKVQLVKHSATALQYYMADMHISANELAHLTEIPYSKIKKALSNSGQTIFKLSQLERIAKVLFVPTVYLTTDKYTYKRDTPPIEELWTKNQIFGSKYKYRAIIEELSLIRKNYVYIKEVLDENSEEFNLNLSGKIENAKQDADKLRKYFNYPKNQINIKNNNEHFQYWRQLIEDKNIIVINSRDKDFVLSSMCLFYKTFPIIVIFNSKQNVYSKVFTLICEIVHLSLREKISDEKNLKYQNDIKRYCEIVTAYVLAPIQIINIPFYPSKKFSVIDYFGKKYIEDVLNAIQQEEIPISMAKVILGIRNASKRNSLQIIENEIKFFNNKFSFS